VSSAALFDGVSASKRFFKLVLRTSPAPRKIVTDQSRSYPSAKAEIPELANVKHVFVKAAARLNNRAENSYQSTRERERRMRGFPDPKTHTEISLVLRTDPAAFRAQAASAARLTLSQATRGAIRCTARIRRARPHSVDRFLIVVTPTVLPSHSR
jgi:transposase-like protein